MWPRCRLVGAKLAGSVSEVSGMVCWGSIRQSSTFQQDASHSLQAAMSDVSPETPLYNEREVRDWLNSFKGGKVDLNFDNSSRIATVTIDHAEKKNAFTGSMMVDLADVVGELWDYKEGAGVIFRGSNGQFCSGGDLSFMNNISDHVSGAKMSIFMQTVVSKLYRLPQLTLGLIEGFALGGGAELSVACNFRVAVPDAKIGFVQTKLGVTTGWGGGTNLTRLIGAREALKLLASARIIKADEAVNLRLLDGILPSSGSSEANLDQAKEWFQQNYLQGSENCIRSAKRVVQNSSECSYSEAMNRERDIFARLWGGPAHIQALKDLNYRS